MEFNNIVYSHQLLSNAHPTKPHPLTRRGLIAISYSNGNIRTLSDDPRNQIGYQEENEGQFIPITNPDGEEMEFKRDGYSIDSQIKIVFSMHERGFHRYYYVHPRRGEQLSVLFPRKFNWYDKSLFHEM